ncbi:hypothetical protein [Streptomyces lomondensis]|uniref:hypothetical protein n=1 Tax=Streptomyces lomondensis TaxID=68229 RepID=UPI0016739DB9|nr:hypothetical protein [Streptomyces lomondensis]
MAEFGGRAVVVAGVVAAALFGRALRASWLVHADGSRVVRPTDPGREAFRRQLGLAEELLATG